MELYKILKTRKGEKNHLKEWITKKKKKKRMRAMNGKQLQI